MSNVATIDFGAGFGILASSRVSGSAGKTLDRVDRLPEAAGFHPVNDLHSKQFDDGIVGRSLSGNGQRRLWGCSPQGQVSRCRLLGSSRSPNPKGTTEILPRPQPTSLGPTSNAKRRTSKRAGTVPDKRRWLLYTACSETEAMVSVSLWFTITCLLRINTP